MKVLYVTPYVPSRIYTRPYHLIKSLVRQGHSVTLLSLSGTSEQEQKQANEIREWGVDVETFPVPVTRSLLNSALALGTREPMQSRYAYHPQIEGRIHQLTGSGTYDTVHIEHLRASRLVGAVQNTPTVYDSVDCISALFAQTKRTSPQLRSRLLATLDLARTRYYEAGLQTRYDHIVITSQRDKLAMERLAQAYLPSDAAPCPITVITNGVDLHYFRPRPSSREDRTLVLTGKMSYHANVTAAMYFAREVLPLVWSEIPDVQFEIVGKDPPDKIRQLARDARIHITGYVDDLRPYLAHATAAVCPVQYAVGVQNKVLEAMAMGTPVISTRVGCAALDVKAGQEIAIAETTVEMAEAVKRVIRDRELAHRLSARGRQYTEQHHNWDEITRALVATYTDSVQRASDMLGRYNTSQQ